MKNWKKQEPDYESLLEIEGVRIAIGAVAVVASIVIIGKCLRLLGGAIEDAKYFVKALKK